MVVLCATLEILAVVFSINHLGVIFKYAIYYLYGRSNEDNVIMVNLMLVRAPYLIWYGQFNSGLSSSSIGSLILPTSKA